MKSQLKNHLSLTKKEWNGMVVMVTLILLVLAAPYIYQLFRKDSTINVKEFSAAVAMLDKANAKGPNTKLQRAFASAKAYAPKAKVVVEVNSADSAKLTSVAGIGPSFAKRIIYYRNRLGGFVNKEQLKEVYGLDELKYDEIKDQLKVDAGHIRKIAINTITFDKLRLMPYLNYKQVNAIIAYRTEHGNYTSIDDLGQVVIVDDVTLRKIQPYLSFK